jgi:hypothetical protein
MNRHPENQLRVDELGRDLMSWATGLGLLRFHLAVFALGATGLVLLNLWRAPAESWSVDGLRLWAIVLACHAAALVAGWSTWRAVRPHRLQQTIATVGSTAASASLAPPRRNRPVIVAPPNGVAAATLPPPADWVQPMVANGATFNGHSPEASPLTLPVRGRFNPPASQPTTIHHHWHPPSASQATAKLRASASGAVTAGRTGWHRFAQATQHGLSSVTARLAGADRTIGAPPAQATGSTATSVADPPPGWPPPPQPLDLAAVPPGWEAVVSPPEAQAVVVPTGTSPAQPAVEEFPGWGQTASQPPKETIDGAIPALAAADADAAPAPASASHVDGEPLPTETEWTWMEAAAAAWLARHDADETGESTDADASSPPGPH